MRLTTGWNITATPVSAGVALYVLQHTEVRDGRVDHLPVIAGTDSAALVRFFAESGLNQQPAGN